MEPLARLPTEIERSAAQTGYYGQPVIKEPVWVWSIPTYFYVGGVAGAACMTAALAGILARFYNMLRVFRPTSPMSVGSWVLSLFGASSGLALLFAPRTGPFSRKRRFTAPLGAGTSLLAGLLGAPLAGYTAVLIACTAVPLWQGSRRSLPVLFTGSAIAGFSSLLELISSGSSREERVVRRLAIVGKSWEALAMLAMEEELRTTAPAVTRPLRHGLSGNLWRASKGLGLLGLLATTLGGLFSFTPLRRSSTFTG